MSKTQKELCAEYCALFNQEHPTWPMNLKDVGYVVELSDGSLFRIHKPSIEKRFCYADHLENAFDCVQKVRADPEFFIAENLREECDRMINNYKEDWGHYWVQNESHPLNRESRLKSVVSGWRVTHDHARPLNSEDRTRIIEMYQVIRADFEKRLRSYVKRYGLKSVHAWTYWADR